jgi:hypothetical protein
MVENEIPSLYEILNNDFEPSSQDQLLYEKDHAVP